MSAVVPIPPADGLLQVQAIMDCLRIAACNLKLQLDNQPVKAVRDKHAIHLQKQLLLILQELSMLKTLSSQALLKNGNSSVLLDALQKANRLWQRRPGVQHLQQAGVIDLPAVACAQEAARQRLAECNEAAISSLTADQFPAAQPGTLRSILQKLHRMEQDVMFQAAMSKDIDLLGQQTRLSATNFAYGSTPYHSWLHLFTNPLIKQHMLAAVEGQRQLQVWGSSLGWLVYFAVLTYGIPSVGYEILACQVDQAKALAEQHQVQRVAFHAQDMLQADLSDTAILMLTSLCWEEELFSAARRKLCAELPLGSLVIDYTNRLDNILPCVLHLSGLAVSWNKQQTMYVYLQQQPVAPEA